MNTDMDKDLLAAFVDGELPPEEAARVAMHLADHPADQAYVDDLFAANEALAKAFSAPLYEPVPETIRTAIMGPATGSNVVAFRPRPRIIPLLGGLAVAASIVAAAVLLPGLGSGPQSMGVALGPVPVSDPLTEVLDKRPSGAPLQLVDGREAMVLATFAMPDGRFCREFEVIDTEAGRVDYAVGCRLGQSWTVEAAIAEAISDTTGADFATAGGVESDALTRYLERSGAAAALDPAAETLAIQRGWSGP